MTQRRAVPQSQVKAWPNATWKEKSAILDGPAGKVLRPETRQHVRDLTESKGELRQHLNPIARAQQAPMVYLAS